MPNLDDEELEIEDDECDDEEGVCGFCGESLEYCECDDDFDEDEDDDE